VRTCRKYMLMYEKETDEMLKSVQEDPKPAVKEAKAAAGDVAGSAGTMEMEKTLQSPDCGAPQEEKGDVSAADNLMMKAVETESEKPLNMAGEDSGSLQPEPVQRETLLKKDQETKSCGEDTLSEGMSA